MCSLYDDNIALYGKRYYYYIWELPVFALIGVMAGMLGAVFVKGYVLCTRLRARFVPVTSPRKRLAEVESNLFSDTAAISDTALRL